MLARAYVLGAHYHCTGPEQILATVLFFVIRSVSIVRLDHTRVGPTCTLYVLYLLSIGNRALDARTVMKTDRRFEKNPNPSDRDKTDSINQLAWAEQLLERLITMLFCLNSSFLLLTYRL